MRYTQVDASDSILVRKPLKSVQDGRLINITSEQVELPLLMVQHADEVAMDRILITCSCGEAYCHGTYYCPPLMTYDRGPCYSGNARVCITPGKSELRKHLEMVYQQGGDMDLVLRCAKVGSGNGAAIKPMFWHLCMEFTPTVQSDSKQRTQAKLRGRLGLADLRAAFNIGQVGLRLVRVWSDSTASVLLCMTSEGRHD